MHYNLEYLFLYKIAKIQRFHCKKELFCKLLGLFSRLYVIIREYKSFCSCSLDEMCKFQIDGNRTNAHACMPFLRYASVCRADFSVGLWSYRPRATARLGRGSFVFIVY